MKIQIVGCELGRKEMTLKLTAGTDERINTHGSSRSSTSNGLRLDRPRDIRGLRLYDAPKNPGGPWQLIGEIDVETISPPPTLRQPLY